ncbi:Uncharacterized protein Rs2_27891 [Raphanus sativus]|nr:Uncharacterized protein Rs2_27891 [Raphanus sativus]
MVKFDAKLWKAVFVMSIINIALSVVNVMFKKMLDQGINPNLLTHVYPRSPVRFSGIAGWYYASPNKSFLIRLWSFLPLKPLLYSRWIREAWPACWQIWCDGDVLELGPTDGVGFMGGQSLCLFVGDPFADLSVPRGWRGKALEPAPNFSSACSDHRGISCIFSGPRVPTRRLMARGVLMRFQSRRFFIFLPLFGEVSVWSGWNLCFLVSSGSTWLCEILWLVLSRGCVWGSFFSWCCRPGLEVSVAARVES